MEPIRDFLLFTVVREWVWGLFLNGFCLHLTRPLALALVFAIAFARFGKGIGLPALFLPKTVLARSLTGAGVGVLIWQVLLAGYLFEEFATNYTADRPPFCEVQPDTGGSIWYSHSDYTRVELPKFLIDGKENARFRYHPARIGSIGWYSVAVAGAALALSLIGVIGLGIREAVMLVRGGRGKKTADPGKPPVNPFVRYVTRRVPFVVGIVAGWLTAAAISCPFLLEDWKPQGYARKTGEWFVNNGGWGATAAREAQVEGLEARKSEPVSRGKAIEKYRRKFEPYYPVYGVFFLGFGAVLAWNVLLLAVGRLFSPAAGILLLAHLAVGSQTFIDYFFPTPQAFQIGLLGLIVLFARRYKMRFAALADRYRQPVSLEEHYKAVRAESPVPQPVSAEADDHSPLFTSQLRRWNDGPTQPDKEHPKPLVMLCVSGGGSRAAAWTMKVLTELEERLPTFPYQVRMITGASGGIFGAAYYTASLPPPGAKRLPDIATEGVPTPASGKYPSRRHLNQSVRQDFLSPVVRALVQNDLIRQFQPFQYGADRGAAIESAWREHLGGWLDQPFAALRQGELDGWRPSLVFSPMLVEDGRQLVISNLSLRRVMMNLGQVPGKTPPQNELLSRERVEFFKLFPDANRFPLSTAARMSATFPYLFPAVPLPTTPRRRVVDAGYYDNYGVCLAASWLFTHIEWLKKNVSHVAVVHIRDGVSTGERLMLTPAGDNTYAYELAAEGLTTPPLGLWRMRSATSTFRNDNLLHLLNLFFHDHGLPFVTTAFEFPGGEDVSLNFTLPDEEAAMIDGQRGIGNPTIRTALDDFTKWWPGPK